MGMRAGFIRAAAIIVWLATFILLIPSPSRGLPLFPVLLVMGLPLPMLSLPAVNFLLLFSYPIGMLMLLAASRGVIISWNRSGRVTSRVAFVDAAILAVFLIVGIVAWL